MRAWGAPLGRMLRDSGLTDSTKIDVGVTPRVALLQSAMIWQSRPSCGCASQSASALGR